MKALVTGGFGFIGSNLVRKLVKDGYEVTVWDSEVSSEIPKYVSFWQYDINKRVDILHSISKANFDVIFHLAAESRIQPSFSDPKRTYITNVLGTLNVLELAKKWGPKVVYASSSCCKYDTLSSPYAQSKYQGEQLCLMYDDVKTRIARIFNVYGPGEIDSGAYSTVVGIFSRLTKEGKLLTITGDGSKIRDFIHVDDVVNALILLAESNKLESCPFFEIGSGRSYSVNEVADMFQPGSAREMLDRRVGEELYINAGIGYMEKLGWKSKIKLKDYVSGFLEGIS